MSKDKITTIAIKDIRVGQRKRKAEDVSDLVESISQLGLLQPIIVTADNQLVAGYRRLQACKQLGWTTIQAKIVQLDELKTELAEIDENLVRQELTIQEKALHVKRRKEIYEALYPNAKPEVRQLHNLKQFADRAAQCAAREKVPTFTKDMVAKTGISERLARQLVQIGTKIPEDVHELIRGTPVADNKRELLELARKPEEEQRLIVRKILEGATDKVRIAAQLVKYEKLPPPPPLEGAGQEYDVILADPPWRYDFVEAPNRAIENHYPTMTVDEIKSLRIPAAPNAVLFLWSPAPLLKTALEVMQAWGFVYHTCAVWDKEKIGMGYWFRVQHELLLVGTKGKPATPAPHARVSSVIRWPRQEHSRKPEIVYEIIENMFPHARLLELFARRNSRQRWAVWGNEAVKE